MEFETFLQEIKEGIEQKTGFTVEVREVLKNNGVRLHGLILEDGKAVRPTIYAEGLFEAYQDQGLSMEKIISKTDELLQTENSGISVENSGQATILIKKEHVDLWEIDLDELNRVAEENTERMFPAVTLELLEFPNSPIGLMVRSEKFRECLFF